MTKRQKIIWLSQLDPGATASQIALQSGSHIRYVERVRSETALRALPRNSKMRADILELAEAQPWLWHNQIATLVGASGSYVQKVLRAHRHAS